ncbi:hypothetical protein TrLO_g1189 [Triparma laevis f. longispina]|uniref:Glycoside hydrolase family 38 central domain-containing protein n=1 Tax=Triparma laevis f. longispina TaxID=1714387 RepID=A0A9W7L0H7_9STRA|nr:hypothetical protein TrLO_g1189 [Triparma laevis f. longispina]
MLYQQFIQRLASRFSALIGGAESHPTKKISALIFAVFAVLCFLTAKHQSISPTLHITPLSHLDPGWKFTYDEAYLTLAVPIFKQVISELLINPDRTFVMEPVVYVSRFLNDAGSSPISVEVGGFASETEVYTGAVLSALAFRARNLEPGMRQSSKGTKFDTEHLFQYQQLPITTIQSVASKLHSLEAKKDKDRITETWELFVSSDQLECIAGLFKIGTRGKYSESAIRSFLNEYDREVKRMQDLTKRGGIHGSRVWDEEHLNKLIATSNIICANPNLTCNFSCKSLGSAADSTPSTCMLPSYNQAFLFLVKQTKQLEVVGSGWVSHDESLPNYAEVLGSSTLGRGAMRSILSDDVSSSDQNDYDPLSIAWQVDSFGHSVTTAKLFKSIGFRAAVYNRLSYETKKEFIDSKALLFNWASSSSSYSSTTNAEMNRRDKVHPTSLLSVLLRNHYNSPPTRYFETVDEITPNMIDGAAAEIYSWFRTAKSSFPTSHLLYPVGDDNSFLAAAQYFDGFDAVLKVLKNKYNLNAKYSTPTLYLDSVLQEITPDRFPEVTGTLISYSDQAFHSWSGYYSSRVYLKQRIKALSSIIYSAELLNALAMTTTDRAVLERDGGGGWEGSKGNEIRSRYFRLKNARSTLALMMHHDAITGTCSRRVAEDFLRLIYEGRGAAAGVIVSSMRSLGVIEQGRPEDAEGDDDDVEREGVGSEKLGSIDHIVTVGGGAGLADGHNQLGIGSILGLEGAIELSIFNPLERAAVRPATIIVPCGRGGDSRGTWLAVYGDDKSEGMTLENPNWVKSQVFPMLVPSKDGNGMVLDNTGEDEKAGFCKMIMAVSLPAMAGRKVVVFWNEWKKEEGEQPEQDANLHKFGLDGLSSTILTGAQINSEGVTLNLSPNPDLKDNVNDVDFLVNYKKVKDSEFGVTVTTRRTRNGVGESVEMHTRQYVSFPHLNKLSGVGSAGAYVMKWSGFALSRVWLELFGFYLIGAVLFFIARLVIREVKSRRKTTAPSSTSTPSPPSTTTTKSATSLHKMRKHVIKLVITITAGIIIGRSASSSFNNGSLDAFLKPAETTTPKANAKTNNYPFPGPEIPTPQKAYQTVPGLIVIREFGLVSGFFFAYFGGPICTLTFAPAVMLSAASHSLGNPLKQSRVMNLNINTFEADKNLVISISDGLIAFQASILVSDGVVLNLLHHKNGLGLGSVDEDDVDVGKSMYYVESELSVLPKVNTEVVVHYKAVSVGGEKKGWFGGKRKEFFVDDGLTIVKKSYDKSLPTSSNYMPLAHSAGWMGGRETGLTLIGGQPLGVCGVEEDVVEVMIARSLGGDDEKGLGEPLVEEKRTGVMLGVLVGVDGTSTGAGRGGGFVKVRHCEERSDELGVRYFASARSEATSINMNILN